MQFEHLAVGGTFDLLHKGHKDLLTGAFNLAKKVSIGVTSDEMTVALGKKTFYSYEKRSWDVDNFLQNLPQVASWQILKINDVFGNATQDTTIDAICVTEDTYGGAVKINEARKISKMKTLEIVQLPLSMASDGKPISSGRIRAGEISQEGLNYYMYISSFGKSRLTKKMRIELGEPQGKVYSDLKTLINEGSLDEKRLISVGDKITYNLMSEKIFPSMVILDFKIERKEVFKNLADLGFRENQVYMTANNPAGEITYDLISKLHSLIETTNVCRILVVDGEEDLGVLPITLMSPLGYRIVYGQRNRGIVSIDVDPPTKRRFLDLFDKFDRDI